MNCSICKLLSALDKVQDGTCAYCSKAICGECRVRNHFPIPNYPDSTVTQGWFHDECIPQRLWGPRIRCQQAKCPCRIGIRG